MKIVLPIIEKEGLELQHSKERDRRVADRIKGFCRICWKQRGMGL